MASNAKKIIQDFSSVRLDLDNEPQPDALLRIETQYESISGRWIKSVGKLVA
jgi:hypothetical protein